MSDSDPITRLNEALEGRYRIERELRDRGGMATVYLADDLKHETGWIAKDVAEGFIPYTVPASSMDTPREWSAHYRRRRGHGQTAGC